ncbi:hemolysin family protein [Roseburia sp. MSJ-14]|uniref:hemolysin family protein n=1 Tax=Roseburia sp. MSJ-14 TaxID=2841514 RepID=UPI001C11D1A1|nr:hemolysin family protein [Roseburia sp. MSJ-14]MBU5473033.1 hemolysin family protein [Roseburia sp. MSJ-14]
MIGQILLQIILIGLNAVFACAEIAVISMNDTRLEQLSTQGNKRAIRLSKLTSQPAKFLATIQVAITLSGFLGSAFAADNFSESLTLWFVGIGVPIPKKTLDTISVVLITIILSYFTLIFGELVPKRLAMKKTEQLALGMANLISVLAQLSAPIVWVLTVSTNGILRLCGIDPSAEEDEVSEEEIRMMVDAGSRKGIIDYEEKEFIQNVFEFDDLAVGEFATHRKDIVILWKEENMEQWEKLIHESRHTRYPVCGESVDNVVGILNVKDYFRLKDKSRESVMKDAVQLPFFVPEGIRADVLFRQMKESRNHFAVVLDEYGGTEGIVTINDLLEQLVGDLEDEDSPKEKQEGMEQIDNTNWKIYGNLPLNEVAEMLEIALPVEKYDTFSGYVFATYGSIPRDGSKIEVETDKVRISVTKIYEHQVEEALIHMI